MAVVCLIFSFVFSLLEGGLLYYSLVRLEGYLGVTAVRIDSYRRELLRSCRLSNHLFNIVFVVEVAGYLARTTDLTETTRFVVVLSVCVCGVVVLGELAPLAIGRIWAEGVVSSLRDFAFATRFLMLPFIRGLSLCGNLLLRILGKHPDSERVEQKVLELALDGAKRGLIAADEADMIEGVVTLHRRTVDQVMTPRTDIVALESSTTVNDAFELFRKSGHSRLPVYEETLDNIVGVLYAKDLLFRIGDDGIGSRKVAELTREPLFVPETKPVFQLLRQMRRERTHIAVVVDEYGGTSGIVTLEDLLEEVVGEIEDEFERKKDERIKKVSEGVYIVDGRTPLEELGERIGLKLQHSEPVETIAGLIILKTGRIPVVGERVKVNGILLEVLDADARRVKRIRLRK